MIYLFVLRHTSSGLLWVGKTAKAPKKAHPTVKHWKWRALLAQDPKVELLQVRGFRDPNRATDRLRSFKKEYRIKVSACWVNSDCYLNKQVPYVYLIRHRETGCVYVGSKFAKGANPSEFFTRYFTSSRRVKEIGWENFKVIEIKACRDQLTALSLETRILQSAYDSLGRAVFLDTLVNRAIGNGVVTDERSTAKCKATKGLKSAEEIAAWKSRTSAAHQNRSPQDKAVSLARNMATRANRAPGYLKAIYTKASIKATATKAEHTVERRLEILAKRRATIGAKTPEEIAASYARGAAAFRVTQAAKSDAQLAAEEARKAAGKLAMSAEAKSAKSAKFKETWAAKPEVEKDARKLKISRGLTGTTHSAETRARMSAARKGTVFTASHRANLSAAKLGRRLA